jgi:hypothetical protein
MHLPTSHVSLRVRRRTIVFLNRIRQRGISVASQSRHILVDGSPDETIADSGEYATCHSLQSKRYTGAANGATTQQPKFDKVESAAYIKLVDLVICRLHTV